MERCYCRMLHPSPPIVDGLPQEMLCGLRKRSLKRLPIGKHQVFGFTQHNGFTAKKMTDRNIGRQPDLFHTTGVLHVVTSLVLVEYFLVISTYGITNY